LNDAVVFLGAMQICIARTSYGNMSGWVGGWLAGFVAVCLSQPVLYQNVLKLFRPFGSPIIWAFSTPYAGTKFQGEHLHWGV